MKRREFVKSMNSLVLLAGTGAIPGLSLFLNPSKAAAASGGMAKFFVLIRVSEGWDVTLGLDPRIHAGGSTQSDMFIEYRPEDIGIAQDIGNAQRRQAGLFCPEEFARTAQLQIHLGYCKAIL